jgi:hypothetical protein
MTNSVNSSLEAVCRDLDVTTTASGSQFYGAISQHRYRHALYKGCSRQDIDELEALYSICLPEDYRSFMSTHCGATLFDGAFLLYGLSKNFDRSVEIEQRSAVSLHAAMKELRLQQSNSSSPARLVVGSVIGYSSNFDLFLETGGVFTVSHGDTEKNFSSFNSCINCIIRFLCAVVRDGHYTDEAAHRLERDLLVWISMGS